MRILLTGMTNGQCGQGPKPGYVIMSDCMKRLLMTLGHEVDNRKIAVGEDYGEYDLIIAGIFSPFSINSKFIYPVTDMLDRYWREDAKPVMVMVDDWTLHQIDQNSRSTRRQLTRLTRKSVFDRRPGYDWATTPEGYSAIARVYERVTETGWPPMILPVFGWGDASIISKIIMAEQYWPVDPVAYMPRYSFTPVPPEKRSRSWVLAVIQEHSDWMKSLGMTWDLAQFGGGMTKRGGETLSRIEDVIAAYARSWGVLSPPYKKLAGSGWWRERFVNAAMTGSVVYCDPKEAPQLGLPYAFSLQQIEAMSAADLSELARAQRDALRAGCWDAETLHQHVTEMLASVTRK